MSRKPQDEVAAQVFFGPPPPALRPLRPGETAAELAVEVGLVRCTACGEFRGAAVQDGQEFALSCICDGIPCPRCKANKIRRPISDHFNESDGRIWHTPYFGGLIPCSDCKRKAKGGRS